MKLWLIHIASLLAVSTAFLTIGKADLESGQEVVASVAALLLLQALYVPRWPRWYALKRLLRLKPGQKVTVEGK